VTVSHIAKVIKNSHQPNSMPLGIRFCLKYKKESRMYYWDSCSFIALRSPGYHSLKIHLPGTILQNMQDFFKTESQQCVLLLTALDRNAKNLHSLFTPIYTFKITSQIVFNMLVPKGNNQGCKMVFISENTVPLLSLARINQMIVLETRDFRTLH